MMFAWVCCSIFSLQQSASSFVLPPTPQFIFEKTIYKLMHEMYQKITHDTNLGIIIWAWEYLVYSVFLVLITRLSLLLLLLENPKP
jgi:hypothetical protein